MVIETGGGVPLFFSYCNFYTQTLGERGQDIVFCPQLFFPTTAGNSLPKMHSLYWKGVEAERIFRRPCIQCL